MRKTLVFDIETIPDVVEMDRLKDGWDPDSVALGVLKDPDKIRDKIADSRRKFMDGLAKKCSLDPLFGRVASIAIGDCADATGEHDQCRILPDFGDSEADLLAWAWNELREAACLVAFNGIAFDARWMRLRSAKHGITPPIDTVTKRYALSPVCDIMQVLADWTRAEVAGDNGESAKNWHSANDWCRFFGIPSPKADGMDGSRVWETVQAGEWEKVRAYNLGDIRAERSLYLRMMTSGLIPEVIDDFGGRRRAA